MITMLLQAALLSAATALSPQAQDSWLAFTGCWRAENAPPTSLICFVPGSEGVRMLDIANGATRETRIVADGQRHPRAEQGCTGFESASWSADGERLMLQTELTCGDKTLRKTSGIFAFTAPNQWVSIQAITVGKQGAANTTRYSAVDAAQLPAPVAALLPNNRLARETARYAAAEDLDFDDVREALAKVEPRAVEALLMARHQPFDLTGKKLLALAEQGVPDYVIDAMIAVSYPDVFEVLPAPQPRPTQVAERRISDTYSIYTRDRFCDTYRYSPWSVYDRYDCGYGYSSYNYLRASPLGIGGYSPWGYYYNTPIIIVRDRGDSGEAESSGGKLGRHGYSRGSGSNGEHAQPRSSGASVSRPAGSSVPSSSRSSGGSSGGSSTGRTAQPRDK